MKSEILALAIFLPLFFLVFFLATVYIMMVLDKNKSKFSSKEGLLFLEIDLKKWRVKKRPLIWNEELNKNQTDKKIKQIIGNGWINIDQFFLNFDLEQKNKWKNAMEFCIQNKTNTEIKITFAVDKKKKEQSHWHVEFLYYDAYSLKANIKWINRIDVDLSEQIVDKKTLLADQKVYKLFAAFRLKSDDHEYLQNFLYKVNFFLKPNNKRKEVNFFISKNIVIFVFKTNNFAHLIRIKNRFIKRIFDKREYFMVNNLYDASTYVEAENMKNESDFAKIMTRIFFGLTKSKLINEPFHFNLKNVFFDEFEEYKKTLNNLNLLLKGDNFDVMKKKIMAISDDRKILNYYFANSPIEFNNWLPFISEFIGFDQKWKTIVFNKVMENYQNEKKILLDTTFLDVQNNFEQMKMNNKIIYVFEAKDFKSTKEITDLVSLLKKHNLKIGLKIDEFSSKALSIIENTKPNILILSDNFNQIFSNDIIYSNIRKTNLILICERLAIVPIFENIDPQLKNTISLTGKKDKYYYLTT